MIVLVTMSAEKNTLIIYLCLCIFTFVGQRDPVEELHETVDSHEGPAVARRRRHQRAQVGCGRRHRERTS